MSDFAVCVTFDVEPARRAAFAELVCGQARDSLAEPGCCTFEVWSDPARPSEVFLWEVYRDEAAFRAHLETPHFRRFEAAAADMLVAKRIATWRDRDRG